MQKQTAEDFKLFFLDKCESNLLLDLTDFSMWNSMHGNILYNSKKVTFFLKSLSKKPLKTCMQHVCLYCSFFHYDVRERKHLLLFQTP